MYALFQSKNKLKSKKKVVLINYYTINSYKKKIIINQYYVEWMTNVQVHCYPLTKTKTTTCDL